MEKRADWGRVLKNVVFFLDVVLALMIIFFSAYLIQSTFGKFALLFGFAMLAVTTLLKFVQKW